MTVGPSGRLAVSSVSHLAATFEIALFPITVFGSLFGTF